MKTTTIKILGFCSALLIGASAQAALIRVTPTGVASNEQEITDPVPIGGDGFRLTYHSRGNQADILNPLILIIATPDGAPAPTIADGPAQNPDSLTVSPNPLVVTAEGAWSGADNNIYAWLGLGPAPGGASQNYSNWTGALDDYGIDPITTWNIFTVELHFDPLLGTGDWNEFVTDLAVGTYVVGWGCTGMDSGACESGQATPFTFAGLVTQVPEPGTLSLLGTALLGGGLLGRRRRSRA
jgi:hypothetical protein